MTFLETIKRKIGEGVYDKLNKEADREVVLAIQMPLLDQYRKENYYRQRFVLPLLQEECEVFEKNEIKISPIDVVNILFKCKILFASSSEEEYRQRSGGYSFVDEYSFVVPWKERSKPINDLIEHYFSRLESFLKDRVLVTEINSFRNPSMMTPNLPPLTPQQFFEELFCKLNIPFIPFFEGDDLIQKHRELKPNRRTYNQSKAKSFFTAPSFGHKAFGSEAYCQLYSTSWLRTFFNLLRIAGFVYPGQIDFGQEKVQFKPPTSPVFLGNNSMGCFCWEEDKKRPWEKIPDGCLFLSFGYRGLSDMYIDRRTFGGIEKFFLENKKIFECLRNPWSSENIHNTIPTLDILSSATQIPDVGAKVLQIYCCLEHMFVPKNVNRDNKKYIIGGINALNPSLLPWFNNLHQLRCDYAHQGFILKDKKTHGIIVESIANIMILLIAKLNIS